MGDVAPVVGRLDAENAVIGSLLIDESIVPDVLARVDAADFVDPGNKRVFQAARLLLREGASVDPVTIRGKLGPDVEQRLLQLMEITPTSANWREYADAMHEQAVTARIRGIAQELTEATGVEECRSRIAALGELLVAARGREVWTMKEAYRAFMAAQAEEKKREYVSFGLEMLDSGTYIEPGDVLVIGGEPSSGKTAFALATAYHMAKTHSVGFFSLETGCKKLTDRLVASAVGIDFNAIKRQNMTDLDWCQVAEAGADFTARGLQLIQAAGMTVSQISAEARARGFDVIVVDYVQLIDPEVDPRANQTQAIAAISRALHRFAQASGVLVVELAQLSRPQQKNWREPGMHDLKESGQLEQDADAIFMLYRPRPGGEYDWDHTRILKIAKQKEGRLGKWPLEFDGAHQRFKLITGRRPSDRNRKVGPPPQITGQQAFAEIEADGNEPF